MDYKLPDELIEMIKGVNELYDLSYIMIKPKVEFIISHKVKNSRVIERVLDELLDIPTDKCYQLFLNLCNYFSSFNKEEANEYINIYKNLYFNDDLDDDIDEKKLLLN